MCPEPEISVVLPAFNEAESVGDCVGELRGVLVGMGRTFEIIVVDDGSTDETFAVLQRLKASVPELRALRFARRAGQTAAMAAGFRHARSGIVVTLDADGQADPADIPILLDKLAEWDVVCGVRTARSDSFLRRVSSRIANAVRNRLTGDHITDTGCTLKAYRREFLERIPLFKGMHRFLPTLLRQSGARVTEVPVRHRPRRKGSSKYNIRNRLFRSFRDVFAVRWMQSRRIDYEIEEKIE